MSTRPSPASHPETADSLTSSSARNAFEKWAVAACCHGLLASAKQA
jgi:hypothetical protein